MRSCGKAPYTVEPLSRLNMSRLPFTSKLILADGDVLVAVCEPMQPWTMFGKSPTMDHWYMGVIPKDGSAARADFRPAAEARRKSR